MARSASTFVFISALAALTAACALDIEQIDGATDGDTESEGAEAAATGDPPESSEESAEGEGGANGASVDSTRPKSDDGEPVRPGPDAVLDNEESFSKSCLEAGGIVITVDGCPNCATT